jgi:hypothetical protein
MNKSKGRGKKSVATTVFIVSSGREGIFSKMPAGKRGPVLFQLSSGEHGFKEMMFSLIESGEKSFLFAADSSIRPAVLKSALPRWLQDLREKALDCDFHYAGLIKEAGQKKKKSQK